MFYIYPPLLEIKLHKQMLHAEDGITQKGQEKMVSCAKGKAELSETLQSRRSEAQVLVT